MTGDTLIRQVGRDISVLVLQVCKGISDVSESSRGSPSHCVLMME